jgi:hypothetical protein
MAIPTEKKRIPLGNRKTHPPVTVGTTPTVILRANPSRKRARIQADADNEEAVFYSTAHDVAPKVNWGAGLLGGWHLDIDGDNWTDGEIRGICTSGNQLVFVEEYE